MRTKDESKAERNHLNYEGGHVFHYEVTPSCWRPRWFLSDVPDFVRIDHPNRRPKEGTASNGLRPKALPAVKTTPAATSTKPAPTNRSIQPKQHNGGKAPSPLKIWFPGSGTIKETGSFSRLRTQFGRQLGGNSRVRFLVTRWHRFSDGVVIWDADAPIPECVHKAIDDCGLLSRAMSLKAKEA